MDFKYCNITAVIGLDLHVLGNNKLETASALLAKCSIHKLSLSSFNWLTLCISLLIRELSSFSYASNLIKIKKLKKFAIQKRNRIGIMTYSVKYSLQNV